MSGLGTLIEKGWKEHPHLIILTLLAVGAVFTAGGVMWSVNVKARFDLAADRLAAQDEENKRLAAALAGLQLSSSRSPRTTPLGPEAAVREGQPSDPARSTDVEALAILDTASVRSDGLGSDRRSAVPERSSDTAEEFTELIESALQLAWASARLVSGLCEMQPASCPLRDSVDPRLWAFLSPDGEAVGYGAAPESGDSLPRDSVIIVEGLPFIGDPGSPRLQAAAAPSFLEIFGLALFEVLAASTVLCGLWLWRVKQRILGPEDERA